MNFDPSAAAQADSGLFGLPFTPAQARVVIVPVAFDATTSYGGGASAGPAAVLEASKQVDLLDQHFGAVYEAGIAMLDIDAKIAALSRKARAAASPLIARGGADESSPRDRAAVRLVNEASARVEAYTREQFERVLSAGKIAGLLGGDHATPLGAISASAEYVHALSGRDARARAGLGILHLDAHMDLRDAFEGFEQSHASIMFNVLRKCPGVSRLVQIGIRDYCQAEVDVASAAGERVHVVYDQQVFAATQGLNGAPPLGRLVDDAIARLPHFVHVSFDIDALEPSLCPHTGTPVPGGLPFNLAAYILQRLGESGRRVVSFDLVEVCPSPDPDAPKWDANVGARVLYKLCGCALRSHAAASTAPRAVATGSGPRARRVRASAGSRK